MPLTFLCVRVSDVVPVSEAKDAIKEFVLAPQDDADEEDDI